MLNKMSTRMPFKSFGEGLPGREQRERGRVRGGWGCPGTPRVVNGAGFMSRKPKQQQKAFKNAYSSGFSNRKRNAKNEKERNENVHEMAGKMKKEREG